MNDQVARRAVVPANLEVIQVAGLDGELESAVAVIGAVEERRSAGR
jgi:hypothetical protein